MAVISEVPGASGIHRKFDRIPLGWIARLEAKAAIMSGQTSGTQFQAALDRLIAGYSNYLTLEDVDDEVVLNAVTNGGVNVTNGGVVVTNG